jgi:uncharacterized protein
LFAYIVGRWRAYVRSSELLEVWRKKPDRKVLILKGARQTGKTTAVNMFSKRFENYIYLNLELFKDPEV